MWKREKYQDEWIAWVVALAIIIYFIITALFWICIFWVTAFLIWWVYYISSNEIKELWGKILIWFITLIIIIFWLSEVMVNYWKIDKSIWNYSIETAQELKLYKSNKWNYKVESDYWTLIETKK